MTDKEENNDILNNADDLQNLIGREKRWLGITLVCVSLAALAAFFAITLVVSFHGQTVLEIIAAPIRQYINIFS